MMHQDLTDDLLAISKSNSVSLRKREVCKRAAGVIGRLAALCKAQDEAHGRWISVQNPQWPAHYHDQCSLCGWWNTKNACVHKGRKNYPLNYCPNCGCKMDGGDVDE